MAFYIQMSLVSNQCDSYIEKLGYYPTYEKAEAALPEDEHITEEDGDFTKWWDYSYSIVEEDE